MGRYLCALSVAASLGLSLADPRTASPQSYTVDWYTVDGGGTLSSDGGSYAVAGTIGQPDAGSATTAATYTLTGGFWGGVEEPCEATLAILPTEASVSPAGGGGTVAVTAGTGCAWSASSSDPGWLSVVSGATGTGDGTVQYQVTVNWGGARVGHLTIAGQTFTLTQAGASGCAYTVDPLTASAPIHGGSGTVTVTTETGCPWTATSGAAWIAVTSGAERSGNATVGYRVAANTSDHDREGTLTIAGHTVTIGQPAQPPGPWHVWFAVDTLETPFVGDFDGDGKTDIITFTRQNPLAVGDVYAALSSGSHYVDKRGVPDSSDKWHDWFAISTDETVVVGDYDGDGKDDIATWLGKTTRQVYVALSYGTGMGKELVWRDRIGVDSTDTLLSGDANGDGIEDLILFARKQGKVYVALSDGTKFQPPQVWHEFFAVSTYERPRVADVNGDGRADIVTFATDSPTAFGDVYVATSSGTGYVDLNGVASSSSKWHDWFAIDPNEEVRVGDLNGDGKDDFFTFLPTARGGHCYTVLSAGDAMAANELWREVVRTDPLGRDTVFVGDANGDGKADIIKFAQGEGKVYVSLAR